MQCTEVDGILVFWAEAPPPLSAGLVFAVGRRDESFVDGGLTHLVEHLAMSSLAKSHLDCNGSVDLSFTEFTATGRPEAVSRFLAGVCTALASLPTDRLGTEAGVLRVEGATVSHPVACVLLAERYGARDLGLAGYGEPRLEALDAHAVRAWSADYFHRDNACLWLTGSPPPDLRLPLPGGQRPTRRPVVRVPKSLPAWTTAEAGGVGLGFEGPRESEALLRAMRVGITRAIDVLRHERGLSYYVDFFGEIVDAQTAHIAVVADAAEARSAEAAETLWQVFHRLADEGPTAEEIEHDQAGAEEHFADPRAIADMLRSAVHRHLSGRSAVSADQRLIELRAATAKSVAEALRIALTSTLAVVPDGTQLAAEGLAPLSRSSPVRVTGKAYRRRLRSSAPRRSRLVVGFDGVTLDLPDGACWTVLFDECVGAAAQTDGTLVLIGADGWSVPLSAQDWRDGDELLQLVEQRLPSNVHFREQCHPEGEVASGASHRPPAGWRTPWPLRRRPTAWTRSSA